MSSMQEVRQLLTGSRRINEMKREVDLVISIIMGFLIMDDVPRFKLYQQIFCFYSGGLCWTVSRNSPKAPRLCVRVTVDNAEVYSSGRQLDVALQYVQPLHEGLPQFLSTMTSTFPQLSARLQPLLAAGSASN